MNQASPKAAPSLVPPHVWRRHGGADTPRWCSKGEDAAPRRQMPQLAAWRAAGRHDRIWSQYLRLAQCCGYVPLHARRIALEAAVALGDSGAMRTVLDHSAHRSKKEACELLLGIVLRSGHVGINHGHTLALIVAALKRRGAPLLGEGDVRRVMLSLASTRDTTVLEQGFLFLAAQHCDNILYYRALLGQLHAHGGRATAQSLVARWLTGDFDVSPALREGLSPHVLRQLVVAHIEAETLAIETVERLV